MTDSEAYQISILGQVEYDTLVASGLGLGWNACHIVKDYL